MGKFLDELEGSETSGTYHGVHGATLMRFYS